MYFLSWCGSAGKTHSIDNGISYKVYIDNDIEVCYNICRVGKSTLIDWNGGSSALTCFIGKGLYELKAVYKNIHQGGVFMAVSKAQQKAVTKYMKNNYDSTLIRMKKAQKVS